jgi:hypothetical protein
MKNIVASFLLFACAGASAADFSVGITPEGLDLYSISKKGISIMPGSPYVSPLTAANPLAPVKVALSSKHDFAYVLYTQTSQYTYINGGQFFLVGLSISPQGLKQEWVKSFDVSPGSVSRTSIKAGADYVTIVYAQDGTSPDEANIIGQDGSDLAYAFAQSGPGLNMHIQLTLSRNENLYYDCHYVGALPSVSLYRLEGNSLVTTSFDAAFVQSVCD